MLKMSIVIIKKEKKKHTENNRKNNTLQLEVLNARCTTRSVFVSTPAGGTHTPAMSVLQKRKKKAVVLGLTVSYQLFILTI